MHKKITWWFTGLSGAGKTTLAEALAMSLREANHAVCVLDGDALRKGLSSDLGFSAHDREEQSRRVAEIARTLNENGILVIAALISPTVSGRNKAREIIGRDNMREIHISTPLEICRQRDVKGLYEKARKEGEIQLTGIKAPYEIPTAPDLVIDTTLTSVEQAVRQLIKFCE